MVQETRRRSSIAADDIASVFSATPPIEALRYLLSLNMSSRHGFTGKPSDQDVLCFIDISRAHPHCEVKREVYVTLPAEAKPQFPGECALLERCLYGLRDAPQAFELKVGEILKQMGYTQGVFSTCLFYNPTTKLSVFVHGDDFVVSGQRALVQQFAKDLNEHLIVKVRATLGPLPGDDKHVTMLNRIITWCDRTPSSREAIEIEADPRHAELVCSQLGPGSRSC